MNNEWKPYPRDRKIKILKNYVVVIPDDYETTNDLSIPLFCDVCELVFESSGDEKTYKKFGCCEYCANMWAYSHSQEWKEGWRPNKEQIESSLQNRMFARNNITFE